MTHDRPILVIGGGPAGASASLELAGLGFPVLLVEQRDQLGGAIHRQPAPGRTHPPPGPARHHRRWHRTLQLLAAHPRIRTRLSTVFLGVEATGLALLDDRQAGVVEGVRPRALVVATGAIERVHPFPGWESPGVMTAGGAQILLKETGEPPAGPILVAGSGPLLYAVAAQLLSSGARPLAVLERATPLRHPLDLAKALTHLALAGEALSYAGRLAGVRLHFGTSVTSAQTVAEGLLVKTSDGASFAVQTLVVHDGIDPAPVGEVSGVDYPVGVAGDGREILGADAMASDGQQVARQVAADLGHGPGARTAPYRLRRARRFQSLLNKVFVHPPPTPPPETVVCRCEGVRLADLAALQDDMSRREVRLLSRAGMGLCQGHTCGRQLAGIAAAPFDEFRPSVPRWPLRPVAITSLANSHVSPEAPDQTRSVNID